MATVAMVKVWSYTADPTTTELYVKVGYIWENTVTNGLFVCYAISGGVQTWKKLIVADESGTTGLLVGDGTNTAVGTLTPSVTSVAIGTGALTITAGTGAPSASQPKGSLYLRTDGSGINDRMYVAIDAVGTWAALVTVV